MWSGRLEKREKGRREGGGKDKGRVGTGVRRREKEKEEGVEKGNVMRGK